MPTGVPATAVAEAGDMPDEDRNSGRADDRLDTGRRAGDPLPIRGLH